MKDDVVAPFADGSLWESNVELNLEPADEPEMITIGTGGISEVRRLPARQVADGFWTGSAAQKLALLHHVKGSRFGHQLIEAVDLGSTSGHYCWDI